MHYRLLTHILAGQYFNSLWFILDSTFNATGSHNDGGEADHGPRELDVDSSVRRRRNLN